MVKCTCGRVCHNITKLNRHIERYRGGPDEALHLPDREHPRTDEEVKRYGRGKKR